MRRSGVSVLSNFMLEHFGKRFKQWLTERGVTLMDVAKDLRISYTNIYSFGAPPPLGRMPGPENAGLIAEYLGVPREEFFSAMGQIDPLLLEEVTPEEVEAGFLKLHEWLKRSDAKSVVEDERKRRWQRLYEKSERSRRRQFRTLDRACPRNRRHAQEGAEARTGIERKRALQSQS